MYDKQQNMEAGIRFQRLALGLFEGIFVLCSRRLARFGGSRQFGLQSKRSRRPGSVHAIIQLLGLY